MDIDGYAVSRGMPDLRTLPLDRFCNFIWWWATKDANEQSEIEKFRLQLWIPPKGEEARGPWSPEEETKAFASFKSQVSKGR